MKYKVGDKVKLSNEKIGTITNVYNEHYDYQVVYFDDGGNLIYFNCKESYLIPQTNRQWLESLSDEQYARAIQGLYVMWNNAETIEFADYLEKWLQAEHKE